MGIRFLATISRQHTCRLNAPSVDAAIALRPWFVGIDIAGDEKQFPALSRLAPLIRRARGAGLHLSIHAGEGGGARNVRDAILRWGASRIGHGVRVIEDPRVLDLAIRRGVAFEMCPTSNRDTGAWRDVRQHPIRRLLRAGALVTLNTDDPAISGIDLVHEWSVARNAIGLSLDEIKRLQRNGAEAAFLGPRARGLLFSRLDR